MKTNLKRLSAVAKTIFSSSCTRFCVVLLSCLLWTSVGWGQSTANYNFATYTNGSLALDMNGNAVDMTTGTTQLVAAASDQGVSAISNIGFNFYFYGSLYTQFSVSANGVMQLGSTAVATTTYVSSGGSTTSPRLGALTADAITASSTDGGGVFSKVVGTGSNRCLVVQWTVYSYWLNSASPATFQIRLYESTGVVEYVYGAMPVGTTAYSSNYTTGFSVGTTANTLASITTSTNSNSYSTFSTNAYTAATNITNLHSTADGSRRIYRYSSPVPASGPTNLTFASVTASGMTLNWTAASPTTGIVKYAIFNSTNGGSTYNYVNTVALGTNTYAATGLTPSTTYTWKVVAISEGAEGVSTSASQATTAATTYYWVGATGGTWSTAANWNTAANGSGSTRTTAATTDVLIVDGAGTTAGGSLSISVDAASFSIGQLKVTSNTNLTLASSLTTQRVITIIGGTGDDFVIENGSSLLLTNTTNTISIIFAGIGNTGDISGTFTIAGSSTTASSANSFLTTGGTSTIVTVTSSGVINNTATTNITTNGNVTGTTTSLVFANGSQYNVSGATTGAPWVPLATWGATSTINITGITTSTSGPANSAQSFGNFIYNCSGASATFSCFTTASVTIQGNLTITSTGTGKFRALTSGTLTVNGNVNINGGSIQPMSGAGTLIVLGNTIVASGASLDLSAAAAAGSYSQRGSLFTNNGTIIGGNLTTAGSLNFYSPTNTAMTLDGSGTISTALTAIGVQTTGGLTISHLNQIATLRVNLFYGTIINSSKITIGSGAALACIVQTGYAGNTLTSGSFDQSPTLNLGTGTYSLIYSQESANRTTGFEIPSTRVLSNITLSNSNGITINGGALSSAALTFSAGCGNITTSSSNVLTITGTATTSITRTSTTAFVNGPLELTLPASLVSGSTYLFPVGKTALYPYELVNPTTTGSVIIKAEAFDGNCGGTAGNVMATISSSRYWAASISSGSANLTNTNIRLTDASTTGFDAIANSATQTGAYDIVGGTTSTVTATTILSTTPLTSISGFYVMGSKAAATLATPSITPSGNQCTNVSRAISVVVTPGGGAVTSVALNYSINGTAQTAIAMTNTTNTGSADTWTGTIPTVSPTNASITWSITATDANALTRTVTGTGYQDEPNTGITATASATPSSVCAGSSASLSINVSPFTELFNASTTAQFNIVNTTGTGTSNQNTAYFAEGSSSTLFNTVSTGADVQLTQTNSVSLLNYSSATLTFSHICATEASYDFGYIQYSTNNGTTWSSFPTTSYTGTGTLKNSVVSFDKSSYSDWGTQFTATTSTPGTGPATSLWKNETITIPSAALTSSQFKIRFRYTTDASSNYFGWLIDNVKINTVQNSYSWSDGSSIIGTTNPLSTSVTGTPTYTCTATVNGCTMTAAVTPTVNPLPTAPTATNSSQCGAGVPTASVADNNSYTTPTFKWYSASSGGTLLQSSTSTTYITSISTTTTFYVAVVNASTGCESARTAVTVSVTQPDAISATTSAASICLGQSVTLTAANTASTPTQNYTYSWVCATTGSGATSANTSNPASITPSAAGSYTFTVTGTDGACNVTNTVAVTVNTVPSAISLTPNTTQNICAGNIQSIIASGGSIINTGSIAPVSPTAQGGASLATASLTYYQIFDVLQPITFSSVDVYPTASVGSTGTIYIANNLGTILTTANYTVTNNNGTTPHTVVLNFPLSIGTGYRIGQSGTAINLIRNSTNQTYPVSNSYLSITGNSFSSTYWYYVYNWNYSYQNQQTITWTPSTDLYTNAAATTAYTGNPTTVYSKPTANRTYTATATASNQCTSSASVTLNYSGTPLATAPANNAYVFGATTNTNYNTAANWYTYSSTNGYAIASSVPTSSDVVVIPATSTCVKALPSLSATSSITDLEIQSGSVLSLNGNSLSIAGALSGTGTIKGSSTSSLSFTGSASNTLRMDQTTLGTTNVLRNLTLSGTGTTTLANALNITAGASSGSVTAGSGTTLTTGGFLTLKSDASGTARIAQSAGTISGNVTQERFVPGKAVRKWSFLASPVTQSLASAWQQQIHITGAGTGGTMCNNYTISGTMTPHSNGFDVTQLQNPSFYTYDAATDNFVANTTGTSAYTLTPGDGYMVLVRGDRNDATNGGCVLLSANNQAAFTSTSVTLAATGAVGQGTITKVLPAGYSFIGNPYPCELDFPSFNTTNTSVISGGYWTYYPTNATYTFSTYNNGTSINGGTQVIANGQSFLVNSTSGGTITFNEAHKSTTANNGNFRLTKTWDELLRVGLLNNQSNRLDEVVIRFGNDAAITKSINEYDAASVNGGDQWIKTMKDATELAIQTRPNTYQNDTVSLAIHAKNAGTYQLGFSEYQGLSNTEVYLIDQQENLIQNVKALPSYEFSVGANTTTANRFKLIFEAKTSGVAALATKAALQVYPNPTKDKVRITCNGLEYGAYQIKVRTITGAEVLKAKGTYYQNEVIELSLQDLAAGMYMLELSQDNGFRAIQKITKQ